MSGVQLCKARFRDYLRWQCSSWADMTTVFWRSVVSISTAGCFPQLFVKHAVGSSSALCKEAEPCFYLEAPEVHWHVEWFSSHRVLSGCEHNSRICLTPFQSERKEMFSVSKIDLGKTCYKRLTWGVPPFEWILANHLLSNSRRTLLWVFIYNLKKREKENAWSSVCWFIL